MTQPETKQQKLRLALRLVGSLVGAGLLVYLLAQQDWKEIADALHRLPLWSIIAMCALIGISRVAVALRWHALLHTLRVDIPVRRSLSLTFAGLFASNFLPSTVGGDVLRLAGAIRWRYAASACTVSLVLDRLVGLAGMAMVMPIGLHCVWANSPHAGLNAPMCIPGVTAARHPRLQRLWQKGLGVLGSTGAALQHGIRHPRHLLMAFALTWVHMLCQFAIIALFMQGVGEPMPFRLIAGLWSLVYVVTLVPLSINGWGVQEVSISAFFHRFGGVSLTSALMVALLMRTLMVAASLPGVFCLHSSLRGTKLPEGETAEV